MRALQKTITAASTKSIFQVRSKRFQTMSWLRCPPSEEYPANFLLVTAVKSFMKKSGRSQFEEWQKGTAFQMSHWPKLVASLKSRYRDGDIGPRKLLANTLNHGHRCRPSDESFRRQCSRGGAD